MTRREHLTRLNAYYSGHQYDDRPASWDTCLDQRTGAAIPFRSRKPSTILPIPKLVCDSFSRALLGQGRRPIAVLADVDGTADNALLAGIIKEARLYRVLRESTRRALSLGTGIVAWKMLDGGYSAESWDPTWATPVFLPGRFPHLASIDYRFPFKREVDGQEKTFIARQYVDAKSWQVWTPVEDIAGREPEWGASQTVQHELGFVPCVWFIVGERCGEYDGTSVYASLLDLFDDLNYTASQQARALYYNLDPQLVLDGVSESDVEQLKKGGANTWTLPAGADAKLLESSGGFVTIAQTKVDALRKVILDSCAVILNDPERISGGQSGSALELLLQPMITATDDLREDIGDGALVPVLQQMLAALGHPALAVVRDRLGAGKLPSGPWSSLPVTLHWGTHLPSTPADALTAAQAVTAAVGLGLISRGAAARYLAGHFGIADTEQDQLDVEADEDRQDQRVVATTKNSEIALGLDQEPVTVPPRNGKRATVTKEAP